MATAIGTLQAVGHDRPLAPQLAAIGGVFACLPPPSGADCDEELKADFHDYTHDYTHQGLNNQPHWEAFQTSLSETDPDDHLSNAAPWSKNRGPL